MYDLYSLYGLIKCSGYVGLVKTYRVSQTDVALFQAMKWRSTSRRGNISEATSGVQTEQEEHQKSAESDIDDDEDFELLRVW